VIRRFGVWLRPYLSLIVVIAIILLAALPILTYPLGRDQGEFATIGRGLLGGKIPYVDLWNPKPPAVFYIYAGAMTLFGRTTAALRAIDLLIAPLLLWSVWWLGRRVAGNTAAWLAALLFGIFYFNETFWTLTQNDGIALLPMTLAMVCVFKAADGGKHSWLAAFGAGIFCGWAIWFKYPFAIFAGTLALSYWVLKRSIVWRDALAFALGIGLIIGAGILYLASLGAWDDLVQSANVTASYTALGLNWTDFSAALRVALGYRGLHWGVLFLLTGLGIFALLWQTFRNENKADSVGARLASPANLSGEACLAPTNSLGIDARALWVLLLWLLSAFIIMASQAKAYDYHWLPMLPPLALLGAAGVVWLPRPRLAAYAVGGVLAVGLFAVVWGRALPYLTGAEDQYAYYAHFQGGELNAEESQRVADYLRAHNVPYAPLYIWGFRPEIYYLTELYPPTRFIFQFPLVAPYYPQEWREENVDTLWAALPPYVAVLQVDYMPWVTGSEDDSNTLLQSYEELNDWLIYNYTLETQIGNFFLWRRNTA
jgi:hypothetical protein